MPITKVHQTQVDINGTTPLVVTNSPASTLGDVLYAAVTSFSTDTVTGPGGWSVLATADSGATEAKVQLWTKTATGSEGTTYSWSSISGTLTTIDFFQLTGVNSVTHEDVAASTNTGTAVTNINALSVTTVTTGALLLAWWLESGAAGSITRDGSMSGEGQLLATGFPLALGSASLTLGAPGATGNKNGSWVAATAAGAILLAVRPSTLPLPFYNSGQPRPRPRPELRMWDAKFNLLHLFRRASGTIFTSPMTGTLSFSGATVKQTRRPITATLALIGSVAKLTSRALAGTLALVGAMTKQTRRTLAATLALTGALINRTAKALAATLVLTGSLTKTTSRALSSTLALLGATTKKTARLLAGTLSFVGSLTASRLVFVALSATLSFAGSVTKRTGKALAATLVLTGSQSKLTSRTLPATLALVGSALKQTRRLLPANLPFRGSGTVSFQSVGNNRVASTTVTIAAFNPGSAANRLLVVFIGSDFDRSSTMAVTYGGTALTLVPGTRGGAGAAWSEFWYLINPSSTPSDVVATWTSTANVSMAALAFNGVDQSTAVQNGGTTAGSASTPNITITSAAGDMTVAGVTGQIAMSGSTQTERWNDTGSNAMTAGSTAAGAATVNHQWTTTGGFSNQISGLDVVAFSSGGGGTLIKQTRRTLAGTLVLNGVLATIKAANILLQATLSFSGSITKRTLRALPATLVLVGSTSRFVTYPLSATLSFLGTTLKQTNRILTATLALVGSLTTLKAFNRLLVATLSFGGSVTKQTGKLNSATLQFVGTLPRRTTHAMAATLTFVGAVLKQTRRTLAGTLPLSGIVTASHLFMVALSATLAFAGSLAKRTGKLNSGTLSFSGAVTRRVGKLNAATLSFVGDVPRRVTHSLAATLSFAGAALKQANRTLRGTLSFSGFFDGSKGAIKLITLTATLAFNGVMKRTPMKRLAATLVLSGSTTRNWLGQIRAATEYVVTILGRIAYAATHRGADARVETIRGVTAYYPAIRGVTAYRHA